MKERQLNILGIRGVPAAHGGFETFAEKFALYMVERGWSVTVYCQNDADDRSYEDEWQGVRRVHIASRSEGPLGTMIFDWRCTLHCARRPGVVLTLGYNTAVFGVIYRLFARKNIINMDGVEWRRQKWSGLARRWFWLNDWLGCWLGDHLVADNPHIADHLATRTARKRITMIPYGADKVGAVDEGALAGLGLAAGQYAVVIARPEPENSILEIVQAWSSARRGKALVVLGRFDPANAYHNAVKAAASDEVMFPGAIYDGTIVRALRKLALFYVHGHQVGGTNPSLVEAMAAQNAILAHGNPFNRWVAGDGAVYFSGVKDCAEAMDRLLTSRETVDRLKAASEARHADLLTLETVHAAYEALLSKYV